MANEQVQTESAVEPESATALEGGSYDVIRRRLLDQATELSKKAEALNQRRVETFGGSQIALLATDRVRTENNCVPRDIRTVRGQLLFGYNVFVGLRTETQISDVFSVHELVPAGEGFELPAAPIEAGHFLADGQFVRDFTDLYRYNRETKLLQLRVTDTRLLAIFQVGQRLTDLRVFRWAFEKDGSIRYMDSRGDEDNVAPRQHDFAWTQVTRDDQRGGDHPHFSILDEVFVDTVGGDLTIKVEDNTKDGKGVWREPVEDKNQTLDDADIAYAKLGAFIILRIKPYRENAFRYLVYNTRNQAVVRVDAIGESCLQLPEDQGLIFPGGYYLRTGEYKLFEGNTQGLMLRRVFRAPNGEDVLYVYERLADGFYLLLPYNVIRQEVSNPITCHGYSVFDDGKLVVFRSTSDEPTKVHPMQIWGTPFCTQEHAASAPTDGSFLAKIGNAELVRGISEALTLVRLARNEHPTRQTYEDVVSSARRMGDAFHWLGHAEAMDFASTVTALTKTAELVIDEFEKVTAIKKRSAESLAEAEETQARVVANLRPDDIRSIEDFMGSLADLRKQRGHLITLREMRYMDLARVDQLEKQVVEAFDAVSKGAVQFLLKPAALAPLVERLSGVVDSISAAQKSAELKAMSDDTDKVGEGLGVLSDIINGLKIDDPTVRTSILEGIGEVYGQLNRARATLVNRRKELAAAEGRHEFAAQFKLYGQAVVSALALSDTPEKCDETMSRLLLQLEELEGRFGEFDEFLESLAAKREEVTDSVAAKRQTLLDERQRRAQNIVSAADRIVQGIVRKARTLTTADELNTYFASDAMVLKLRDLSQQLLDIGASVKADEIDSKLKSARQDALRALRDKADLFDGGENVLRFGKHRFNVNTQPVELALVPRRDDSVGADVLYVHLTGTDFYEKIVDAALEEARDLWDQQLVSETPRVYRSEYLAARMVFSAERGEEGLVLDQLVALAGQKSTPGPDGAHPGLLEAVRAYAQTRHDEGYERGVHDVDAALILERVLSMFATAGLLRYSADARALACLAWAGTSEEERALLHRRGRSYGRLRERLRSVAPQLELAKELEPRLREAARAHRLEPSDAELRVASRYLVEELADQRVRFVTSGAALALEKALHDELEAQGSRSDFDEDLRSFEQHPAERLGLVANWLTALVGRYADLGVHAHALREAAVLVSSGSRVEREPSSAVVEVSVTGLFGQHPLLKERSLHLRLDEWLARLERYTSEQVPRFRAFRKTKQEILERERRRLRIDEYAPKILSSFVRNRLIDEVYLPIVGDNLAKQLGAAGDGKRTDQMGLLLLVSPPGYGKTTLMEYVANKLGLVFMKINGPALGHEVTSIDPADAPNATARQEVEKINLALEMGNNVMLYLDDIQHTNPELLQKFISLCDAQRRIEGVWNGRTRTYDLRGKKFCVVMAGNPYTESGEKFKIPDMLANRADTYNLGDILAGKDDLFALSFIENALTSNQVLAPLSGREPEDTRKLIKMAQGEPVQVAELSYPYSAAEVGEITAVLTRLFQVQKTLLRVNKEYILSASQDDQFRTEPAFKLQGSYRNMNKVAEKIVSAHTEGEVEEVIDNHYAGESQTLTTGAEHNLLKLAELRGRQTEEQKRRWNEIKKGFVRVKTMGGAEDDPIARVTGTLATLGTHLDSIHETLSTMAERSGEPMKGIATGLDRIHAALGELGDKELLVQVERDPALADIVTRQLGTVESTLAPVVRALADSLILAGQSAHGAGAKSNEALEAAMNAAASQVQALAHEQRAMLDEVHDKARALAAAQAQQAQAQQAQAQALAQQAREAQAQAQALAQAREAGQHVAAQAQQAAHAAHAAAQAAQQGAQAVQQSAQAAQQGAQALQQGAQMAQQGAHAVQQSAQAAQQGAQALQQGAQAAQQGAHAVQQSAQALHQGAHAAHATAQAAQATAHAAQQGVHAVQQKIQAVKEGAEAVRESATLAKGQPTVGQQFAGAAGGTRPPTIPPGGPITLVQRPDASPEENEMIARAQQAIAQARAQGAIAPEVSAAVFRVESKLAELTGVVGRLQQQLAQRAAGSGPASSRGGHALPRYDAVVDLQSQSNFYKWRADAHIVREGGVFVSTRRKLPDINTQVVVALTLPGQLEVEAQAVVEWVRPAGGGAPPGFGARFVDLPSHAVAVIDQFITARAPMLFEAR